MIACQSTVVRLSGLQGVGGLAQVGAGKGGTHVFGWMRWHSSMSVQCVPARRARSSQQGFPKGAGGDVHRCLGSLGCRRTQRTRWCWCTSTSRRGRCRSRCLPDTRRCQCKNVREEVRESDETLLPWSPAMSREQGARGVGVVRFLDGLSGGIEFCRTNQPLGSVLVTDNVLVCVFGAALGSGIKSCSSHSSRVRRLALDPTLRNKQPMGCALATANAPPPQKERSASTGG